MKDENSKKLERAKLASCGLPTVPDRKLDDHIDPNRLRLVRYSEKKWVNGTILHYHFLESPRWALLPEQLDAVRAAFAEWKALGIGLEFVEVTDRNEAEIRIGFDLSDGSWSYVGRDCIDFVPDPNDHTMNFGWDLTTSYGRDTALHEIGHALGFPHEHQNPNAGIVWNEPAVFDYFRGAPNYWNDDMIQHNVLRKIPSRLVEGSNWDRNSVMHYSFRRGLITQPEEYQNNDLIPESGLSAMDISEVKKFYPEDREVFTLEPYHSAFIEIEPTEQLDYRISPPRTREYTIQTFGPLDTVIVLFEEVDGESHYLDGDDDSGYGYNSKMTLRLYQNRTYVLRLRLYYSQDAGHGAVMIW